MIWTSLTWFGFRLEQVIANAQSASKNDAHFKSSQKGLKNNDFALLV